MYAKIPTIQKLNTESSTSERYVGALWELIGGKGFIHSLISFAYSHHSGVLHFRGHADEKYKLVCTLMEFTVWSRGE